MGLVLTENKWIMSRFWNSLGHFVIHLAASASGLILSVKVVTSNAERSFSCVCFVLCAEKNKRKAVFCVFLSASIIGKHTVSQGGLRVLYAEDDSTHPFSSICRTPFLCRAMVNFTLIKYNELDLNVIFICSIYNKFNWMLQNTGVITDICEVKGHDTYIFIRAIVHSWHIEHEHYFSSENISFFT